MVLLDLGLPDQDGYEVCGKIRKRTSTPVIMVTARSDVRSRIHGLNLGADDYVVKPYDTGELLARIHAVSRRSVHEEAVGGTETELRLGPVRIELPTRQVSVNGTVVQLTRKEFDLLALLAQRPGSSSAGNRSSARCGAPAGRAPDGPSRCTSPPCAPNSVCPPSSRPYAESATGSSRPRRSGSGCTRGCFRCSSS
ncbi:hypothetical protein SHKM778_22770 [Streptomyces sp. KM77-8]|uniref:Sensory transduction protein RegX3 n=1 Tax=Streptomyces haneummycinicus TaxID=3074435 RepID=A0AAT9HER3_9ACTN